MVLYGRKVGVVGGGVMGSQIAEIMALNGREVVLRDLDQSLLDKAMARIRGYVNDLVSYHAGKAEKEIRRIEGDDGIALTAEQKEKIREKLKPSYTSNTVEEVLSRITPTLEWSAFSQVDVVVEAAVEDIEEKKRIFAKLDEVCPRQCILTSNTSTLSVTEMASATKRRDRTAGVHFFNPPVTLPLVELIPSLETSEETIEDLFSFVSSLRNHRYPMQPIRVKEVPGFLVNRILTAMMTEAFALYEEGVSSMRDIDLAMRAGAGMPMGPFELADLIGLDVLYHIERNFREMTGSNLTLRPSQLVRKMYFSGRLGRKAGRGFYEYR